MLHGYRNDGNCDYFGVEVKLTTSVLNCACRVVEAQNLFTLSLVSVSPAKENFLK